MQTAIRPRKAQPMPTPSFALRNCFVAAVVCLSFLASSQAQNINWGPFRLNLGAVAEVTYTDNKNSSENNPESDTEFRVGPTISGAIIISPTLPGGEQLTLNVGASYEVSYSLKDGTKETFSAPINVALVLPFYVAKWDVTISDTFSFSDDPLEKTFAFNRDKVPSYNNTAQISVGRNFGRVGFNFAASRSDKLYPDDPDQEETSYQFSATPSYFFRDNYSVFLRNTYGITDPHGVGKSDSDGYSSEVGVNGQITQNLSGSVSVGWSHSNVYGTNGVDHVDGISSTIALNYVQPLRPNTTYSIAFARSPVITAALQNSDITEATSVTLSIAHRLSRFITLAPVISWNHLQDLGKKTNEIGRAHV